MRRLILISALALLCACAQGQDRPELGVSAEAGLELWPAPDRDFQHRMSGRASAYLTWRSIYAEVYAGVIRWMKRDTKAPGSPFQGEASKVWEVRHGGSVLYQIGPVSVGAWVGRRSAQTVDYKASGTHRNAYPAPYGESAKGQMKAGPDEVGDRWPGLSYWDGLRPELRVALDRMHLRLRGPLLRWHTVSMPYPGWLVEATVGRVSARGAFGGLTPAWVYLSAKVLSRGAVSLRAIAGWVVPGGYPSERVRRAGLSITISH